LSRKIDAPPSASEPGYRRTTKGETLTRVWLPDSADKFGALPPGIEADVWTGGEDLPDTADQVEFVVLPLGEKPEIIRKIGTLPSVKTVQILSAGADNVLPYLPAHITLCNARGAHTAATAEWTVGVIVASLRNFPLFAAAQRDGRWDWTQSEPVGGKHVLIVGYGDIGAAVERRLAGWEVTIDRVARHARDGVHAIDELPELLKKADVVVILVPVTDETRQFVNKDFLRAMKDGALLVNAARGVIVDTDALLEQLTSGRIRAALDVTDPEPLPAGHPLWQAPGLLLTPHVAGSLYESRARAYKVVSEQLARLAAGEPLHNVIGNRGY
jgi:phosphoglycerate dehydrogenase-like enzyme